MHAQVESFDRGGDVNGDGVADVVVANAYTAEMRCGCGAAVVVNALVSADAQRTMLTAFFAAHQVCMARALAKEPGALPMNTTITCSCGKQIIVNLIETPSEEMDHIADGFISDHRPCAMRAGTGESGQSRLPLSRKA